VQAFSDAGRKFWCNAKAFRYDYKDSINKNNQRNTMSCYRWNKDLVIDDDGYGAREAIFMKIWNLRLIHATIISPK